MIRVFVYRLSIKLLAYNFLQDTRGLLFHLLCVMCIEILRDGGISMTKACCNIHRFRSGFDKTGRMCMAKTVFVQL